jgi:hypothetical protein
MTEAKDPETVYVVLWPDGKPLLAETEDPSDDLAKRKEASERIGVFLQPLHVTTYDRRNPELQAHRDKAVELLLDAQVLSGDYGAICRFQERVTQWLAAERKLRGGS